VYAIDGGQPATAFRDDDTVLFDGVVHAIISVPFSIVIIL